MGLAGLAGLQIAPTPPPGQKEGGVGKDSVLSLLNLYEGRDLAPQTHSSFPPQISASDPSAFASVGGISNMTARAIVLRLAELSVGDGDGLTRRAAVQALGKLANDPAAGENEPLRIAIYAVLVGVASGNQGGYIDDLAAGEARDALQHLDALYEGEGEGEGKGEGEGRQDAKGEKSGIETDGGRLSRRGTETYI